MRGTLRAAGNRLGRAAGGEYKGQGEQANGGRVFVSIMGHYTWTFDDPLFRTLLLRGIAWSAHEPVDRFNNLIEAGLTIEEYNGIARAAQTDPDVEQALQQLIQDRLGG